MPRPGPAPSSAKASGPIFGLIPHRTTISWAICVTCCRSLAAPVETAVYTICSAARPYSEATAREVDTEVKRIADECFAEAIRLLTEHRPQLDALAQALLRDDSLNEDQILSVTGIRTGVAAYNAEA